MGQDIAMNNEPLILAFCCHYCAYAAADLAGSMRLEYPDHVRVLRLPCTGKVEIDYMLAAFERGVDGVIVAGCLGRIAIYRTMFASPGHDTLTMNFTPDSTLLGVIISTES